MSYLNKAELAQSPAFRQRILAALPDVAGLVTNEDQSEMGLEEKRKRLGLAVDVMVDPAPKVQAFVWPVISNPIIGNAGMDAEDSAIQYQVLQMWGQVAGVTAADKAAT